MQSTHTLSHFLDKQRFFDERVQHKLLVYKLLNKKQKKIIIIETVKLFYDIKKNAVCIFSHRYNLQIKFAITSTEQ